VFMRNNPTGTYDPPDLITSTWVINFLFIDANTLVLSKNNMQPLTRTFLSLVLLLLSWNLM